MTAAQPEIRTATVDDFTAVCDLIALAFGDEYAGTVANDARVVFEPERTVVATNDGGLVGTAGVFSRRLTLPGGPAVPAAHVTMVGVSPGHRRRGILTGLMRRQLSDLRAAGEPVALLWASEGRIYQRFGYGLASTRMLLQVDAREARLTAAEPPPAGRLRDAPPEDCRKELAEAYERVRTQRPGWSSRDDRWWDWVLADPPARRRGASARRALLYDDGGVEGYALWRTKASWSAGGPEGEVQVNELVAATPAAYRALWSFLLTMDLTRTVRYAFASADEPLLHLLDEPRRVNATVGDAHWLRLVDVPGALAARRYSTPLDTVIEVGDALLPANAGRWRLRADGDEVSCTPGDRPAQLACDVSALAAAYLGGVTLTALAAAGRVSERQPGALPRASAAFLADRAPSGIEIF